MKVRKSFEPETLNRIPIPSPPYTFLVKIPPAFLQTFVCRGIQGLTSVPTCLSRIPDSGIVDLLLPLVSQDAHVSHGTHANFRSREEVVQYLRRIFPSQVVVRTFAVRHTQGSLRRRLRSLGIFTLQRLHRSWFYSKEGREGSQMLRIHRDAVLDALMKTDTKYDDTIPLRFGGVVCGVRQAIPVC